MSDHKAEALRLAGTVTGAYNTNALPANTILALAQVHATLYLAEKQKRTAYEAQTGNLLAFLAICEERGAADDTYRLLDRSVRERLAL